MLNLNKPVPGAREYYPLNEPEIGSYMSTVRPSSIFNNIADRVAFQDVDNSPVMFQPLTIRGVTFKNRIFVVRMVVIN